MDKLVFLQKEEAVTTSLIVAEKFHKRHDIVLRDIRNLDCSKEFTVHNFVESKYKDSTGRMMPMFYLTKDAFMFLVMGYRGKKAADIKEKYIAAFNAMESLLHEKSTTIWIETRKQGKLTRKEETDEIKKFIQYAISQGSNHSSWYYRAFSELADKMCGIKPKHRDDATTMQLNNLAIFENIILEIIRQDLKDNIPYKEIYQHCKERCNQAKDIAMIG